MLDAEGVQAAQQDAIAGKRCWRFAGMPFLHLSSLRERPCRTPAWVRSMLNGSHSAGQYTYSPKNAYCASTYLRKTPCRD